MSAAAERAERGGQAQRRSGAGVGGSGSRRLVIVDGSNAVYRAFFALPNLRAPDGSPTNAVYGFVTMMAKLLRDEQPDLIVVALDPRGGSFRRRIYPEYKANRDAQPEDLSAQFPVVREAIDAFRVPVLEVEDFEADDVIATLVEQAPDDVDIRIVSTDKDLMQLVSDRVHLLDTMKGRVYTPEEVETRFGVPPERMLDLRSLVGDPSDNIPGVKGIGEKGAAKLIGEWGDLENLLDNAAEVKAKRAREALLEQRDEALLSKQLSTLRSDVPLPEPIDGLVTPGPDIERLRALYERLGFSRLLDTLGASPEASAAPRDTASAIEVEVLETPSAVRSALKKLAKGRAGGDPLCVHLVREEGSAVSSRPVGLGLALDDEKALYIPLVGEDLTAGKGLSPDELWEALGALWPGDGGGRAWAGVETKEFRSVLDGAGGALPTPTDDIGIAAFLLDPAGNQEVASLAKRLLGRDHRAWEEVTGRGAKAVAPGALPMAELAAWVAERACAIHALRPPLREKLAADGLLALYEQIELPLTDVLSRMERAGVRVDEARLHDLSVAYEKDLARIEAEIYELAGERFLIGSPKQLQVILFEKLKLPPLKKTKTGYSTAEGVLEQLSSQHELPGRILAYRRLSKLKSTYIDALPPLVDDQTGRIHTRFHQLGAATGRLSASHPNVQNIPIRVEEGARIREAFVPAEGNVLLAADYSQVELRILAHYSGDESLIEAFRKGEDIHRRTAAEVAGIELEAVTAEQRARAKAVNFGIIYGSSAFGLANNLGIATAEAQQTIDAYFERYHGVRRFLDETIEYARKHGHVSTLLGRRRYLPDITSRNRVLKQAAERMAVNSVIQGTAADLIKRAMVAVDRELRARDFPAQMILQVHDELVFELAERDTGELETLLRELMVGALELTVPLTIDVGIGANWREAH